jgi:hypothetical protein
MMVANLLLAVVIFLVMLAAVIAGRNYAGPYGEMLTQLYLLATILVSVSAASIIFFFRKKYFWSFTSLVTCVFLLVSQLTITVLPAVEKYKGTKELAAEVTKVLKPSETIAAFDIGNRPGVVFYNSKTILFLNSENEAAAFLKEKNGYLFTQTSNLSNLIKSGSLFRQMGELAVLR